MAHYDETGVEGARYLLQQAGFRYIMESNVMMWFQNKDGLTVFVLLPGYVKGVRSCLKDFY